MLSTIVSFSELIQVVIGHKIEYYNNYYNWEKYSYNIGFLNPVTIKQGFMGLLLFKYRKIITKKVNPKFFKPAIYLYFISIIWLIIFRDFSIMGARGATFFSFTEFIILPSLVLCFKSRFIVCIFIFVYCLLVLNLNIYYKNILPEYSTFISF